MNILPEQNELILKLKEAYKEKGLTLNGLIDMMPEDSMKLGRSTVQRLFHGKESEHKKLRLQYPNYAIQPASGC